MQGYVYPEGCWFIGTFARRLVLIQAFSSSGHVTPLWVPEIHVIFE